VKTRVLRGFLCEFELQDQSRGPDIKTAFKVPTRFLYSRSRRVKSGISTCPLGKTSTYLLRHFSESSAQIPELTFLCPCQTLKSDKACSQTAKAGPNQTSAPALCFPALGSMFALFFRLSLNAFCPIVGLKIFFVLGVLA